MAGQLPRGVERVARVRIAGVDVQIVRATAEQNPKLRGSTLGYWDPYRCVIWLAHGQTESQERDTVAHELTHAFLELTGLKAALKVLVGPKNADRWDGDDGIEEMLVRHGAPHIAAFCKDWWTQCLRGK